MKFYKNAAGFFVTYENGVTEEVSEKSYNDMLRRQLKAKAMVAK